MRLLNVRTLCLEEFFEPFTPSYAILSHTWGSEEILYHDVANASLTMRERSDQEGITPLPHWGHKKGASKVLSSAALARTKGLDYIWIDTCCIDKTSSAELSEAVNSMFRWYSRADVCLAYLVDFALPQPEDTQERLETLSQSRWFRRGWTLQELIAPETVELYDMGWNLIGARHELSRELHETTSIAMDVLRRGPRDFMTTPRSPAAETLRRYSVSEKMSWAADRQTTREEDIAYCLLGIFDINMPLLYGEGTKAFARLQKKVLKQTNDQSILVFDRLHTDSILASSPSKFKTSVRVRPITGMDKRMSLVHNDKLSIDLFLCPVAEKSMQYLGILSCLVDGDSSYLARPAVVLNGRDGELFFDSLYSIYLVRLSEPFYAVPFPNLRLFTSNFWEGRPIRGGKALSARRIIPADGIPFGTGRQVTVHIHGFDSRTGAGGGHPRLPRLPFRVNPIEGHSSLRYQLGPSIPPLTRICLEPINKYNPRFGGTIAIFVSVACIQDRRVSYPVGILCAMDEMGGGAYPVILADPTPVAARDNDNLLPEKEVQRMMTRMTESLKNTASAHPRTPRHSVRLRSGERACAEIRKIDFFGVMVYDLHITIN
ncbi:heterokaryon incompatibility protein-domain-containing protein [Xylaria palmicola]|nr:heterokaryon incompatibility protein-domain-containing protein [Xylaria palmicola]